MREKVDYGVDAPGVIRNLITIGAFACLLSLITPPVIRVGTVLIGFHPLLWWTGIPLLIAGMLMLLYAKVGKFRHRDRMLALHAWTGNERVLDVGTGRGLLLVGAAKHLTSGHATGMDIWNREDLSGNAEHATLRNLELEKVAGRCTLVSQSAQKMSFADDSFDVVVSNLCLHNIYNQAERQAACREIARVLVPGGTAILSDYKHTAEYASVLQQAGLKVERKSAEWLTTYPPLRMVVARKPEA